MSTIQLISLGVLIIGISGFYALGFWGIKRLNEVKKPPQKHRHI